MGNVMRGHWRNEDSDNQGIGGKRLILDGNSAPRGCNDVVNTVTKGAYALTAVLTVALPANPTYWSLPCLAVLFFSHAYSAP